MGFLESLMYATLFIGAGWVVGVMAHDFACFVMDSIKKENGDDHE